MIDPPSSSLSATFSRRRAILWTDLRSVILRINVQVIILRSLTPFSVGHRWAHELSEI